MYLCIQVVSPKMVECFYECLDMNSLNRILQLSLHSEIFKLELMESQSACQRLITEFHKILSYTLRSDGTIFF